MVDISEKEPSLRIAEAKGEILLEKETIAKIKDKKVKKGDILATAQMAAILAVKNTPNLIPLCHNIPIDSIDVSFEIQKESINCACKVKAYYRTGVEMESLVGVTTALLNIWDMVKYLEKDENGQYPTIQINNIRVVSKFKEG